MRAKLGRLGALMAILAGVMFVVSAPAADAAECSSILGSGSSLQAIAENEVFIPNYKTELLKAACPSKMPTYAYKATSSGTGLGEWGVNGALGSEAPFPAFIGTDVAPEGPAGTTKSQLYELDFLGGNGTTKNAVTAVPVAQSAVSIIVSLPENCNALKTFGTVTNENVEGTWLSNTKSWLEILGGNIVNGTGCSSKATLEARLKASGTTAGFKRYLNDVNSKDWAEFVLTAAVAENTKWPTTVEETGNGSGGELAEKTYLTPGALGYADLADAVARKFTTAPVSHTLGSKTFLSFIAEVQSNGLTKGAEFESPAQGKVPTKGSNCKSATYQLPSKVAPNEDWSGAKQVNWNANYPICTLTFDLGWLHYGSLSTSLKSKYETAPYVSPTEVAESVGGYLSWIPTAASQGAAGLVEHEYAPLSTAVKMKAEEANKGFFQN